MKIIEDLGQILVVLHTLLVIIEMTIEKCKKFVNVIDKLNIIYLFSNVYHLGALRLLKFEIHCYGETFLKHYLKL